MVTVKNQISDVFPFHEPCYGCFFVSQEGGCDISWLCGRPRISLFRDLGYEGMGGPDCPLWSEDKETFIKNIDKYKKRVKWE